MGWRVILHWTALIPLGIIGFLAVLAAFAMKKYWMLLFGAACVTAAVGVAVDSEWLPPLAILMMLGFVALARRERKRESDSLLPPK